MSKVRNVGSSNLQALLAKDHTLYSGVLFGLDGYQIKLEARAMRVLSSVRPWRDVTKISGMARGPVFESLDRIAGAFAKYGIPDPQVEILVNLAPPEIEKDGTWLDLPLAIIMMQAAGMLPDLSERVEDRLLVVGELGLHGDVRRVPGVLSIAYTAKPGQSLIVPAGNEKEAALILAKPGHEGCNVYPVSTFAQVAGYFEGKSRLESALKEKVRFEPFIASSIDFGRIRGQEKAKRGALIAAAGGHNLLLIGPPGEGKSLIASAIPGILPRLNNDEKVELTRIYSACGELTRDGVAITRRPMRSVHHTSSKQALIGGGSRIPKPGEVTLAHHGILFLDELAEFSSASLESLRQPMESGEVTISRVGASLTYPCRFTLVAAMNPCPCGYFGHERCKCKPAEVRKYQSKISGPIVDRIDLQVELARLSTEERFAQVDQEISPALRQQVESARQRQNTRFQATRIPHNAAIPGGHVREYCQFSGEAFEHYKKVIDNSSLSTRSMDRLAKVSRTIADLEASETVEAPHIDEAASYVVGGMLRDQA